MADARHDIAVTSEFKGTDNLDEGKLEGLLLCPDFRDAVAALKDRQFSALRVVATFAKLQRAVYTIDLTYMPSKMPEDYDDRIRVEIHGRPSAVAAGPVIKCHIDKFADAPWQRMEVVSFVLGVTPDAKDGFRQRPKPWPGWGPRGMLVVMWVAYNCGVTTIDLDDAWDRIVPGVPPDVYVKDYVKDHDVYQLGGQIRVKSSHYSRVLRLLRDRAATTKGSDEYEALTTALAKTSYATDLRDQYNREYDQAQRDGTLDAAIAVGYYGLFNFEQSPEAPSDRQQRVIEIKGTRSPMLRTTAAATPRWACQ